MKIVVFFFEISDCNYDFLSLGNLTIKSDNDIISSKQKMIIILSIIEILDGVRNLFLNSKNKYLFVGVGSNFSFQIEKKTNFIEIYDKNSIIVSSKNDLIEGLWEGLSVFFYNIHSSLIIPNSVNDTNYAILEDLKSSLECFSKSFNLAKIEIDLFNFDIL